MRFLSLCLLIIAIVLCAFSGFAALDGRSVSEEFVVDQADLDLGEVTLGEHTLVTRVHNKTVKVGEVVVPERN